MMKHSQVLAILSVSMCIVLFLSGFAKAAPYDYDTNVRDLLEALYQKESQPQAAADLHRLVRKNNRSPSLRLRFGRRSDPAMAAYQVGRTPYEHNPVNYNVDPALLEV